MNLLASFCANEQIIHVRVAGVSLTHMRVVHQSIYTGNEATTGTTTGTKLVLQKV